MYLEKTIIEPSIDDLVQKGIKHIKTNGRIVNTRSGNGIQADNVTFVLDNCRNRIHTLRYDSAAKYFARELLAYFSGSLDVYSKYGLSKASKFWGKICDENGIINSNYGYYVFYQNTPEGKTQLQWIREQFNRNLDSRKAFININGVQHKTKTLDFPCTVGMLFRIEDKKLSCDVQSRSTDIITGLPYDMGFFSVVTELLAGLVSEDKQVEINPGYVAMHSCYTQIYDSRKKIADEIENAEILRNLQQMPIIDDPNGLLDDIYSLGKGELDIEKPKTKIMKWCVENGKINEK